MTAARADRRRARQIELSMEVRATGQDVVDVAQRFSANHARVATFIRALVDAHSEGAALRALLAARADHLIEVGEELASLIEYGEPALFRTVDQVASA